MNNLFVCFFFYILGPNVTLILDKRFQQTQPENHLKLLLAGIRHKVEGTFAIFDLSRRYSVKLNKLQSVVTFISFIFIFVFYFL